MKADDLPRDLARALCEDGFEAELTAAKGVSGFESLMSLLLKAFCLKYNDLYLLHFYRASYRLLYCYVLDYLRRYECQVDPAVILDRTYERIVTHYTRVKAISSDEVLSTCYHIAELECAVHLPIDPSVECESDRRKRRLVAKVHGHISDRLLGLRDGDQSVVKFFYLSKLTPAEIAQKTGLSTAAIEHLLNSEVLKISRSVVHKYTTRYETDE